MLGEGWLCVRNHGEVMNRVYCLVWDSSRRLLKVVSELARTRSGGRARSAIRKQRLSPLFGALSLALASAGVALANDASVLAHVAPARTVANVIVIGSTTGTTGSTGSDGADGIVAGPGHYGHQWLFRGRWHGWHRRTAAAVTAQGRTCGGNETLRSSASLPAV